MEELTQQKSQFEAFVHQHLLPVLEQRIDDHITFLRNIKDLQLEFINRKFDEKRKQEGLSSARRYKNELEKLLENYPLKDNPGNIDTQFVSFLAAANEHLETLNPQLIKTQDLARFSNQPTDNGIIKAGKVFKRLFFSFAKLPEKIGNLFRKTKKPLRLWTHTIAFKNLTHFYLKEQLLSSLIPLLTKINQKICTTYIVPWRIDGFINSAIYAYITDNKPFKVETSLLDELNQTITELEEQKNILSEEISHQFQEKYEAYSSAFLKAGTFEFPNWRFNEARITQKHKEINEKSTDIESEWTNTRYVLISDWQIDIELYYLIFAALSEYHAIHNRLKTKFESPLFEKLAAINSYFEDAEERIKLAKNDTELLNVMKLEKADIQSVLIANKLPETNDYMLAQGLPSRIHKVELKIDSMINDITQKVGVVKGMDFLQPKPIKASSISYISPYELINFESRPELLKVTQQLKIKLFDSINQIQHAITELGQISEFNLDSALASFDEKNTHSIPQTIALEGIDRMKLRLNEIQQMLLNVSHLFEEDLFSALQKFNQHLIQFTNTDNILAIRVRIAKAKAVERSRVFRKKVVDTIKHFIPFIIGVAKRYYFGANNWVKNIYKKYNLVATPDTISDELADFLTEVQQSVSKLPYVYQRLFNTESLKDESFFIGRNQELQSLNLAYNNWMKGRFATTLIVGEKGCGATSLLNFFLEDLVTSCEIFRFQLSQTLYTKEDLFHFLNSQFGTNFKTLEEWSTFLNTGKKKIVILEDIQRLYLRKVNGFEALKVLNQLISHSDLHTFWVVTCTQYAFNYLDKTLLLSDQFNHLIALQDFDHLAIMDIIMKRHKVSGYNIKYAMAPVDLNNKKIKKLTEEQRQQLLQNEYFNSLNKIAKSNIYLLLTYWIRSIEEISGSTIVITSLKRYDLSFLRSLSTEKVFALSALVLHEQLNEQDFGKVLNINPVQVRRVIHPLLEGGILVFQNGYYSVNPLLYRQTILLLKTKNLIH